MVQKREDLQRILKLLDKALRNLTAARASKNEEKMKGTNQVNPWEKTSGSEIDWSVVKSTKSLLSKK